MRLRQFSMMGMLGLVAVVAVGCASLKYATVLWTSVAATVALGLLLAAVLGAVFLRGQDRGFAAGFALFGIVYLMMVNWSAVGGQTGHGLTGGLSDLAEWVHPEPAPPPVVTAPTPLPPVGGGLTTPMPDEVVPPRLLGPAVKVPANSAYSPARRYEAAQKRYIRLGNFVSIGRYGLCLLFALVGGLTGRYFAREGARSSETSGSEASSAQGR
jgi:hypothetical protein